MRFEDLSPADQQLVNTDLGEFEKDAAEQVALADEMYATGFSKLAAETADYLDAIDAMDKEASEVVMDDESEKTAADLSAFIERGYFDGLCKLGADRHGDEGHYLMSFVEEKFAEAGAAGAVRKFYEATKKISPVKGAKEVGSGAHRLFSAAKGKMGGLPLNEKARKAQALLGAKEVGKGALRSSPAVAGAAAVGYGAKKALGKKKED